MAATDFTDVTGSADASAVRKGPTGGLGGADGLFCFAARSSTIATAAWAVHTNQANFSPVPPAKASRFDAAVRAGLAGPVAAPPAEAFIFCTLQPDPMPPAPGGVAKIGSMGYLLGLSPSGRLTLVKGRLEDGIPDAPPGESGVLRRSDAAFPVGAWLFLRLDVVPNTNGDVYLAPFRSDLSQHPVSAPQWAREPGLEPFIDDVVAFNTGTRALGPKSGGYMGFGAVHRGVGSVASFDSIVSIRGT